MQAAIFIAQLAAAALAAAVGGGGGVVAGGVGGVMEVFGAWGARTAAVQVGPYNLTVLETDAWTLHSIDYGGRPFITPTGFMQTVVSLGKPGSACTANLVFNLDQFIF